VWRHSMPLCGSPQPRRTRNMRKSAETVRIIWQVILPAMFHCV
jgi:hypothetical protein